MKLVFSLSDKSVELNINQSNHEAIVKKANIGNNIREFHTAYLHLNLSREQADLAGLREEDHIEIQRQDNESFSILFAGIIETVEIAFQEDGGIGLEISAISSFSKLERTYVNQQSISGYTGFRQLMNRIREVSGISGKIKIDDDIDDLVNLGFIYNFPALTLLRQFLYQKDLIFIIDEEDTMHISKRENFIPPVAPITEITPEDPRISSLRVRRG